MSVIVVMNTDDASAGSTLAARSPSGTSVPAAAATNMLITIARPSTSPSVGLPRTHPDDRRRRRAQHHTVSDADEHLLQERLPRVAPRQLTQRDTAHDDGQRLRAGVAAHARDDGHEHGQHGKQIDGPLEQPHDAGGEKRGDQVDRRATAAACEATRSRA